MSFFADYPKRYIAQIVIEADTPLNISSGETGILTDSLIMTDANGLPMILGTSLTGVLRHSFKNDEIVKELFGYPEQKNNKSNKGNKGKGSRIIISNAHFVGKDGKVIEGLQNNIDWQDEFYYKFLNLPIRQHAKINHKGVADTKEHGKFDEQIIYKGTRFKFEIELIGNDNDRDSWEQLLKILNYETFRIGGGTRKGFGKLKVVSLKTKIFDLRNQLDDYAKKSASLNFELDTKDIKDKYKNSQTDQWTKYVLELNPEDFYLFGSGLSDNEVDMTPVYEENN